MTEAPKIDTPQEALRFLREAFELLLGSRSGVNQIKSDALDTIVNRNAAIGRMMEANSNKEALQAAIGRLMIAISQDDLSLKSSLDEHSDLLFDVSSALKRSMDAIDSLWARDIQKVAEADVRLQELTERLRAHSISNADVREAVWAMTSGHCFHCEVALIRNGEAEQAADRSRVFHVDHLVPKASGGPDHLSNYVPSCERCNISKGTRSYLDFLASKKPQPALTLIAGGVAS